MKNVPARRRVSGRGLRGVSLAVSFCLLLAAAPGLSSGARQEPSGGADAPIKVGVFLSLSGQISSYGKSTLNGIKMAADEINARGGVGGQRIELIVKDDQGEPSEAVTAVKELIEKEKVHALIGEVASSISLAAAPNAQAARVPMITPSSTHPKVTQVGDYIFRVCIVDPFQGEVMAAFASKSLKAKSAAIFSDADSDYSKSLADTFKQKLANLGGRVVIERSYSQMDRDFGEQLAAIRAARPNVIYVPGYFEQAGVIAKQARQAGMKQPLLGGDGWDAPELWTLGGEALNNSYITNHFSADDPSPATRAFVAGYKSKHGSAPDSLAALGYDAMMLLADALRRAGGTDGPKLRDAIAQTKNFPSVNGPVSINSERNAVRPAVVQRLLDGKFVYHETIHPDGGRR